MGVDLGIVYIGSTISSLNAKLRLSTFGFLVYPMALFQLENVPEPKE